MLVELCQKVALGLIKMVNKIAQLTTGFGKPEADDQTILQIDLRVNGVPNDEIYKDEQYMQSITKQIEKLVEGLQEEPLKD